MLYSTLQMLPTHLVLCLCDLLLYQDVYRMFLSMYDVLREVFKTCVCLDMDRGTDSSLALSPWVLTTQEASDWL